MRRPLCIGLALSLCGCFTAAEADPESWYVDALCTGAAEYRLPDRTRVDCLTDTHAIEYDFAQKCYEAIGQSLWYAAYTARKAGILLIVERDTQLKYVDRCRRLIDHYGLPIRLQCFDNRGGAE